jgi:O-antigen ligase
MTGRAPWTVEARWVWAALALGAVLGTGLALSVEIAAGTLLALTALVAFARSRHRSELVVGVYWVAFAVYSIIFFGVIIRFAFFPFYAVFLLSAALALRRDGLRVDPVVAWLYAAYMVTVLASFVGFTEPIDSAVFQRLLAYLVGAAVLLQFRSRDGIRPVATAAIAASASVAAFVVYSSFQAGFGYRGDVDANPNSAAMMVAFGAVVAAAWLVDTFGERRRRGLQATLILLLGLMLYSILLLASRGLAISLTLVFAAIVGRAALRDWRKSAVLLVVIALAGIGLLLPGGQNLLERFTSERENLETAGSRIPIWATTLDAIREGDVVELAFGHGFDSSEPVVMRDFPGQPSVHSTYLKVLYEFGLVSLSIFVGLHLYLLWRAWRLPGRYGLTMLGLLVLLLLENVTGDVATTYAYWIALGFVAAIGTWAGDRGAPSAGDADSAVARA